MGLKHMISALRFSRLTVFFLVLETVLACAFLCNALAFIAHKAGPMLAPTGVTSGQVLVVNHINMGGAMSMMTGKGQGGSVGVAEDHALEARIRAMPGVTAVSVGLGMPYTSENTIHTTLHNGGRQVHSSVYFGDHMVDALGLQLIKGRHFRADEFVTFKGLQAENVTPMIITRQLAKQVYPQGHVLGLHKSKSGSEFRIVGVVDHLPTRQPVDRAHADAAVILPVIPSSAMPLMTLVVRTQLGARVRVARQLPEVIKQVLQLPPSAHPQVNTFEAMHHAYFASNRSTIWLMLGVTLAVVAITVIGIMGLTGFWVARRTRQIGIRRALGATRGDILRYFLMENLLVVGAGVLLGIVVAYGGNLWLMEHLEIPRLPWQWLPIGAVLLWVLGQLAVLAPARRASRVPPVVATRSV